MMSETNAMHSMMSNYQVIMEEDSLSAFFVKMKGPKDSEFNLACMRCQVRN